MDGGKGLKGVVEKDKAYFNPFYDDHARLRYILCHDFVCCKDKVTTRVGKFIFTLYTFVNK